MTHSKRGGKKPAQKVREKERSKDFNLNSEIKTIPDIFVVMKRRF